MGKSLDTKAEICGYVRWGWKKIERFINKYNFPAKKIGGQWMSHTDLIDEWKKNFIKKNDS